MTLLTMVVNNFFCWLLFSICFFCMRIWCVDNFFKRLYKTYIHIIYFCLAIMQKLKINFMTKKAKTTVKKETVNFTFPNGIQLKRAKSGCNVWHLPQAMTTDEFKAFLSEYRDNPKKAEKEALVEAEKQNFIQ